MAHHDRRGARSTPSASGWLYPNFARQRVGNEQRFDTEPTALRRKLSFNALSLYPRFSILDPEATLTLPRGLTALGLVDIFVHVLEQYVTYPVHSPLQDRQAEAILTTIIEVAEPLLDHLDNYDLRATVMWCAVQAVNGTLSRGVPTDWSIHAIGHELTALYDIAHAQTLALLTGGLYLHQFERKKSSSPNMVGVFGGLPARPKMWPWRQSQRRMPSSAVWDWPPASPVLAWMLAPSPRP